tara:strand:+ start:368 stop:610 length:243 start_codon:yes stop_codon:yes gene_type:complete
LKSIIEQQKEHSHDISIHDLDNIIQTRYNSDLRRKEEEEKAKTNNYDPDGDGSNSPSPVKINSPGLRRGQSVKTLDSSKI